MLRVSRAAEHTRLRLVPWGEVLAALTFWVGAGVFLMTPNVSEISCDAQGCTWAKVGVLTAQEAHRLPIVQIVAFEQQTHPPRDDESPRASIVAITDDGQRVIIVAAA